MRKMNLMKGLLTIMLVAVCTFGLNAQENLEGANPRMEYEYSVSTKTTMFRDSIGAMSVNIANRYVFTERFSLGVQISPTFFTYYSDKPNEYYTKDNDLFLPIMLSFRYDIVPKGKMSPYFSVNFGTGILFSEADKWVLHGGAYVGLDFFRRDLFSLFVEFGLDYGVLGVYTPLKIGFRL